MDGAEAVTIQARTPALRKDENVLLVESRTQLSKGDRRNLLAALAVPALVFEEKKGRKWPIPGGRLEVS